MDQSVPSSKEANESENDSFEKKGLSDGENPPGSNVSSFYEINVHENYSSESDTSKEGSHFYVRPKLMVKVKKIGGNNGEKENTHSTNSFVEKLKKIANPLIESYYPFLEDNQVGNITIEVNVKPVNAKSKESEEKKVNEEKCVEEKMAENSEDSSCKKPNENVTSESQEPKEEKKLAIGTFSKIRNKLKKQILQEMLTKKDSDLKDLEWKDVEDDQLHIHHHEHHHHYYMESTKLKNESVFSLVPNVSSSPVHWSEDKENEFRRAKVLNSDFDVKERETSDYVYDCGRQNQMNFLMEKNSCNLSNVTFVRTSKEEYMKFADKYSPFKPMKKVSSTDSLTRKKSDLVVFHTYSDTEVSKCDSEGSFTDVPSSRSALKLGRTVKKISKGEDKRSRILREEKEVADKNESQGNGSDSSVSKKSPVEKKSSTVELGKSINKKSGNRLDLIERLKTSLEKIEDGKGEFEILVASKAKNSKVEVDESRKEGHDSCTGSMNVPSEGETVNVKSDKEVCNENAKSTTTFTTSVKANLVETSEEEISKIREKYSRSKTPKSATSRRDKVKSSSRKRTDSDDKIALKSKHSSGTSGSSKSKGVVHCYYSCSRNRESHKELTLEKNRKSATERQVAMVVVRKVARKGHVLNKTQALNIILNNNFGQQGKIADKSLSTLKKSDRYLDSRNVSLQFWSKKLRQELKEIKKELRSLEKKHTREIALRRLAQIRAPRVDEFLENGISVYSSRTYILGSSNFKQVADLSRKRDHSTAIKNRNMITQKQITYLYSSPKSKWWGNVQQHTESKFSTKEKGFIWNQHFVSRERKVFETGGDLNYLN